MNVLFEDNHLLVLEKPVNMPVQADQSQDYDLLSAGKDYLIKKYNKPGNAYLGLVHRLDRPVGGVIIFAKTSKAASRLADQLRRRKIKRKYLAVVSGQLVPSKDSWTDYLIKNRRTNTSYVAHKHQSGAKKAILSFKNLKNRRDLSLVSIELETGRSHQIRVQFSHHGHPIIGDQRYGQEVSKPGQQIALWASEVEFTHPTKKELMTITSTPPHTYPWSLFNVTKNQAAT